MIRYHVGNMTVNVDVKQYKDGCVEVDINTGSQDIVIEPVGITVDLQFGEGGLSLNDRLIALGQTVHAIRGHYPLCDLRLYMPYLPYARQDRITKSGGGFGLKYLAKIINQMNFKMVSVLDPHSNGSAMIDQLYGVNQFELFKSIKPSFGETYIVAPDMGALKKCEDFAKRVGAAGVIRCTKHRNPDNMELDSLYVLDHTPTFAEYLILDDIIDGGRTFYNLAEHLRKERGVEGNVDLAATHGLFTYGADIVAKHFDKVYTTNSYDSNKNADNVTVIDIW
ncbi:ribose-phosphate [Pseudomonas phage vB_PpS_SYP]|nr:ribose-phosphate [Pseudomonas phage vB_PpS_SYP]